MRKKDIYTEHMHTNHHNTTFNIHIMSKKKIFKETKDTEISSEDT